MKIKSLIILILLTLFVNKTFAQAPQKFGKIDIADLQTTLCPIDSNAHAYYIFDYGETDFRYDTQVENSKGFQLYFNRHLRIKIVDNEGFSWGNVYIQLYHNAGSKSEVTEIKAFTHNLEEGKITKTKLERSDMHTEETSANLNTLKFAMPDIKAGSIIEIEYTIKSDFIFNLQEWYFQRTIPVVHSEYFVSIPEYFNYNQSQLGYYPIERTTERKNRSLTLNFKETGAFNQTTKYTDKIDYYENCFHYLATNVPSFPDEKFIKTSDNYLTRIKFELQSTKFPNSPIKDFSSGWEEVDKELKESLGFGTELNRKGHLSDDVEDLKGTGVKGEALLAMALTHMQGKISWDGVSTIYTKSGLAKAYKTGQGNSADINLNLVVLLRELGFNSFPVILSTQKNGIIHPAHASISSFNYVIAMAQVDSTIYLLDATDPHSMLNMLPVRCLNDKGRVIGEISQKWVNLMNYKTLVDQATYVMTLDSNLTLTGKVKKSLSEYGAYIYRSALKKSEDLIKTARSLEKKEGFVIDSMKIAGLDTLGNNITLSYQLSREEGIGGSAGMVYFTPCIDPFFDENPFKLEKREFPVEFDYPYRIQRSYLFTIPANYEVTEIPKPTAIKLPNGDGTFYYQTTKNGNLINVSAMIIIRTSLFLPDQYETIKKFFQIIVDKHNEYILLKSI
ncbi:MAG: DUF3857 domain-containing protein [Prolixibacteraceae bacterium]